MCSHRSGTAGTLLLLEKHSELQSNVHLPTWYSCYYSHIILQLCEWLNDHSLATVSKTEEKTNNVIAEVLQELVNQSVTKPTEPTEVY